MGGYLMKVLRPVNFDADLLNRLDQYLYDNRLKSRSAFINHLIAEFLNADNEGQYETDA